MKFLDARELSKIFSRYGLAIVFLIFGVEQTLFSEKWFAWTPTFISNFGLDRASFWLLVGTFNFIVGLLLVFGFITRISAALAALHLLGVVASIGYNDVAVRDIGLFFLALAVLLNGPDRFSLDKFLSSRSDN
ncbi:DoxX family membrane protein [Candidatus Pacearchaeota archaeon]|nr:MAG: DoxX family membrane protein [Candidatus Pacearchaeota archaeon]